MNSEELKAYDLAVENHERAMTRVAELEREVDRSAHARVIEQYDAMLAAAPTVKAEQMLVTHDLRAKLISGLDEIGALSRNLRQGGCDSSDLPGLEEGLAHAIDMAHELISLLEATSLPAAGSAEEEVEVVAWRYRHSEREKWQAGVERKSLWETEPLMTVAQHERIVATLSAQQSAPERTDGWISVSERLPDVAQEVIVDSEFDGVTAGFLDSYGEWYSPNSDYKLTRVVAWQPLPAAPPLLASHADGEPP